jgi:hypothetical protein
MWNESRRELVALRNAGISFLLARRRAFGEEDAGAFLLSSGLGDQHALHKDAYYIPTRLPWMLDVEESGTSKRARRQKSTQGQNSLFNLDSGLMLSPPTDQNATTSDLKANLSGRARAYLAALGVGDPDGEDAETLWLHALAIGYAPDYHAENQDAGRYGFTRVPIPRMLTTLRQGRELGQRVASCVDVDVEHVRSAPGATAFWQGLGRVGSTSDPQATVRADDLVLRGWAVVQTKGVFATDGPVVVRGLNEQERQARVGLAESLGMGTHEIDALLGAQVMDIVMNEVPSWTGVPTTVWDFKVGGYAVLRKWLSYRDAQVLKRPMTINEARGFSDIVRRLSDLRLMGPALSDHYKRVAAEPGLW